MKNDFFAVLIVASNAAQAIRPIQHVRKNVPGRMQGASDGSRRWIRVATEHNFHFATCATHYLGQSDLRGREPGAVGGDPERTSKVADPCDLSDGEVAPVLAE